MVNYPYTIKGYTKHLLKKLPTELTKKELVHLRKYATDQEKLNYFKKHHMKKGEIVLGISGRYVKVLRPVKKNPNQNVIGNIRIPRFV